MLCQVCCNVSLTVLCPRKIGDKFCRCSHCDSAGPGSFCHCSDVLTPSMCSTHTAAVVAMNNLTELKNLSGLVVD